MRTGKMILVGSTDVGKTCLIRKFLDRKSDLNVNVTIWPTFFRCRFSTDEGHISLEVWDMAGQEKFRSVAYFYLKNVDVVVIVFDVTRSVTFSEAKTWATEAFYNCDKIPILILVGNKKDLTRKRVITREEATSYAEKIGALYLECSTKDYQDVCKVFTSAANEILKYDRDISRILDLIKVKNFEVSMLENRF